MALDAELEPHRPGGRAPGRRWPARASWSRAEPAPLEPYTPPDAETIGVTRRQFLNRAIVGLTALLASPPSAGPCSPSSGPRPACGFGSKIRIGTIDDVKANIADGQRLPLRARGPHVDHRVPRRRRSAKARTVYSPAELTGMEAGVVPLFQTCPHLGCRVPELRELAVVRVPVPRLPVQPGGREAGRARSPGHGPLRRRRSTAARSWSTPASRIQGPPDRHQHHRPGGRRAPAASGVRRTMS